MKLYTFQPLFIWETIKELGYFHPWNLYDLPDFADEYPWEFKQAYDWLKGKMDERSISYQANNQHMIWAWYHWNGAKQARPDKRFASVFAYMETPFVLLELDIDDSRVCLTDYDAWHGVLNYWHMGSHQESDAFWETHDRDIKPLTGVNHQIIEKTWDIVFDISKSRQWSESDAETQQIQATFFELLYTDVTKVHIFENKRCIDVLKINHKKNKND